MERTQWFYVATPKQIRVKITGKVDELHYTKH